MEYILQQLLYDQCETVEDQRSQLLVDVLPVLVQERVGAVAQQLIAVVQVVEVIVQPGDVERESHVVDGHVLFAVAHLRASVEGHQNIGIG